MLRLTSSTTTAPVRSPGLRANGETQVGLAKANTSAATANMRSSRTKSCRHLQNLLCWAIDLRRNRAVGKSLLVRARRVSRWMISGTPAATSQGHKAALRKEIIFGLVRRRCQAWNLLHANVVDALCVVRERAKTLQPRSVRSAYEEGRACSRRSGRRTGRRLRPVQGFWVP